MSTDTHPIEVTEQQSREVAEAARETEWQRPSFAKGLYLGHFDLSLIHPHPRAERAEAVEGERFLERLEAYCRTLDGRLSSARRRSRTSTSRGSPSSACSG